MVSAMEQTVIMELSDGRKVYIDGNGLSREDAIEVASTLWSLFGVQHSRVKPKLMYEVDFDFYTECGHYDIDDEDSIIEDMKVLNKNGLPNDILIELLDTNHK